MNKNNEEFKYIEAVLQKWDPIGVIEDLKNDGMLPNEYDAYAPAILQMLKNGCTEDDLVNHLHSLAEINMGIGTWEQEDRPIAKQLVTWWASKQSNQ